MYHESFVELPKKDAYRLRGMATEPSEQGKGYGKMVLNSVMDYLSKETESEILWCNARTSAFEFYEKMGFIKQGNLFEEAGIMHYNMYLKKNLLEIEDRNVILRD